MEAANADREDDFKNAANGYIDEFTAKVSASKQKTQDYFDEQVSKLGKQYYSHRYTILNKK